MKVANIVSPTKEDVSEDFNVVKSLSDITQGLPTLIVGWEYVKETFPKYNIIERKLNKDIFWTFKKTENRDLHAEDIQKFSSDVYKNLVKDIRYFYLDAISLKKPALKRFLKLVDNNEIVAYHHVQSKKNIQMVYVLIKNIIYGLDMNLLEFMGFNKEKILNKVRQKSKHFLENNNIFIEYKKGLEHLDYQVKYIPFLYTIKNG